MRRGSREEAGRGDEPTRPTQPDCEPGQQHRFDRPGGDERGPLERECRADRGEPEAHREEEQRDLFRDPAAKRRRAERHVDGRDSDHPGGGPVGMVGVGEQEPAGGRDEDRVREHEARRREAEPLGRDAELEADRGERVEHPEGGDHGERHQERVTAGVVQPAEQLGRARHEGGHGEPVPAPPEEHPGRGAERDRDEAERRPGGVGTDQHGGGERADNADRGDLPRVPAHGDDGRDGSDEACDEQAERRVEKAVERRRRGRRREERADRRRDEGTRRLGLSLALEEVQPQCEQRAGAEIGQGDARRHVDPSAAERRREEEHDTGEHREAPRPGEDAAAEQLLDVERTHAGW